MNEEKLVDFTTEDLLKKKKLLSTISGCLAAGLVVLIAMIILLTIKSGITAVTIALSIIPIALSPIVLMNIGQAKLIKKELEERNLKTINDRKLQKL